MTTVQYDLDKPVDFTLTVRKGSTTTVEVITTLRAALQVAVAHDKAGAVVRITDPHGREFFDPHLWDEMTNSRPRYERDTGTIEAW